MRRWAWTIVVGVQAALVAGFAVALRSGRMPLGVKDEWEWLRVSIAPEPFLVGIALVALGLYAFFAAAGLRSLSRGKSAAWWLVGLVPMAVITQAAVQEGAPIGFGLSKWAISLQNPGSSGYYTVAKTRMPDLKAFLAAYPGWIKEQDALHVGTHPPGLFVVSWGMLRAMEANPKLARAVVGALPTSVDMAFRSLDSVRTLPIADRAALALIGLATLIACAASALPLYALARSRLSATAAWASALILPLVPSALLFQPTADTAFPLLSTSALALAAWAGRRRWLAVGAGMILAVGTQLSLAFFPVGLVAAIVYLTEPGATWKARLGLIALTGLGFLALTIGFWAWSGANPLVIWRHNAANHARFYMEYPRSYWAWVVENPIELAAAIGLPTTVWLLLGMRTAPRVVWATAATLVVLTLSGKNLSEVGRLWLPMMPMLVVGAGAGVDRLGAKPAALAISLFLLGIQVLVLEAMIQVVYPITV
jgi:hypothetical protein